MRWIVSTIAPALALGMPTARAFFDAPWITPAAPTAGATVSVNLRDGICDAIVEHPGYPQISRQGHAVHLIEYGHHWVTSDLCVYDIGHLVEPIGAFAPGEYTVTVDLTYPDYPNADTTITLGIVHFAVSGNASPAPVPTSTLPGLVTLISLAGYSAFFTPRRARLSPSAT